MPPRRIPPPPADRAELELWLDARIDETARYASVWLGRIMRGAVREYHSSLTAAGDLSSIDGIPSAWMQIVSAIIGKLGVLQSETAAAVWLNAPGNLQPPGENSPWTRVVNEAAVSYMREASNRLAKVGESAWRHLRSMITAGIELGTSGEDMKQQLEDVTGWSEFRADTIARTETIGAYNNADFAAAAALGEKGPVEKVWVATRDARTRESHARAHNQVRKFAEMFDVGGHSMEHPHDRSAPAGEVINCRCYAEFLYPGDERPDGSLAGSEPSIVAQPAVEAAPAVTDWSSMSLTDIKQTLGTKYGTEVQLERWTATQARSFARTYDDLATRYPISESVRPRKLGDIDQVHYRKGYRGLSGNAGGAVSAIDVAADGTIVISGGEMRFGVRRSWLGNAKRVSDAKADGWLAADGPKAAITHEFGHLVGYQARQQAVLQGRDLVDEFTEATRHIESNYPSFDDAWSDLRGKARNSLSRYGASSIDELMAESFAEYEIAGDDCRPFARAIVETMLKLQP